MINTTKQIGTTIRTRRKQLMISQKDLAMTCGTGLRFIGDLENGKPTCQLGKAIEVLHALGLAIETTCLGGDAGDKRP